jgi:hypothetical protein
MGQRSPERLHPPIASENPVVQVVMEHPPRLSLSALIISSRLIIGIV